MRACLRLNLATDYGCFGDHDSPSPRAIQNFSLFTRTVIRAPFRIDLSCGGPHIVAISTCCGLHVPQLPRQMLFAFRHLLEAVGSSAVFIVYPSGAVASGIAASRIRRRAVAASLTL